MTSWTLCNHFKMRCKYCNNRISFFKYYHHFIACKQNRKQLIDQKIKRNLTVPSDSLIRLIEDNLSQLDKVLSQNKFYYNAYNLLIECKLNLEEAIAVNDLFWHAHTPFYSAKLVATWMYLGRLCKDDKGIYAICSDWRTFPPDSICLPIDMVPAEILAEALCLIGIIVDTQSFLDNPPYQEYIENKYASAHN